MTDPRAAIQAQALAHARALMAQRAQMQYLHDKRVRAESSTPPSSGAHRPATSPQSGPSGPVIPVDLQQDLFDYDGKKMGSVRTSYTYEYDVPDGTSVGRYRNDIYDEHGRKVGSIDRGYERINDIQNGQDPGTLDVIGNTIGEVRNANGEEVFTQGGGVFSGSDGRKYEERGHNSLTFAAGRLIHISKNH